jgi:peptidoglycan/LPS O-acetylase OafA/YrhL
LGKIKYLDGLRGLAAYIVVINHFVTGFYPALYNASLSQVNTSKGIEVWIATTPLNIFYGGNFAVCIFFILSGYVLSYKYFLLQDLKIIIESAAKRYFRLLIPVLFSLIIAFLFMSFSLFYNNQISEITKSSWWLAILWNFKPDILLFLKEAFFGVFFDYQSSYNAVLWTMTYEFFGSFMVFGFIALFGKLRNRNILYIVIILLLSKTYYVNFIVGLLLSDLYNSHYVHKKIIESRILNSFLNIVLVISGVFMGSYPPEAAVNNTMYAFMNIVSWGTPMIFYHSIGAFLIMLALLNSEHLKSFFSNRILTFLGKISFSMYIIHLIIICSFSSYLFLLLYHYFSYHIAFLITFILSNVVIIISANYVYQYIDKNALNFSHIVFEKIFSWKQQDTPLSSLQESDGKTANIPIGPNLGG